MAQETRDDEAIGESASMSEKIQKCSDFMRGSPAQTIRGKNPLKRERPGQR